MTLPSKPSPAEFGEALCAMRTQAGLTLDEICGRTKISRPVLERLEAGEFAKLPDQVFLRMFVRQYAALAGSHPDPWLEALDAAYEKYQRSSKQLAVVEPRQLQPRRTGPWIVGLLLVGVTMTVLLTLQRTDRGGDEPTLPSPTEVATVIAPTPVETTDVSVVSQEAVEQVAEVAHAGAIGSGGDLGFTTTDGECWVEIVFDDGEVMSRLLPPGTNWVVESAGRDAEIVMGNAGAVVVDYRGERLGSLGRSGQVVRVKLPPSREGE